MLKLNGKGSEDQGSDTGRGLGNCFIKIKPDSMEYKLGQGMGKRRKAGLIENKNSQNN